ncbi:MAG: rhomboid family intramembrane serine protease [Rhizobiales bacterium]|nr:rhomboid family intramembrane serine protease [Hyphomicrobiales bacterium]OJY43866.1 MAG: rhomboid family intramembrane serine protease [Rhizobiales bacterium 64-17]
MADVPPRREPIFNIPGSLTALTAVLVLIHLVRVYLLTEQQDVEVLLRFAFIPARYDATVLGNVILPGGTAADIWTFVTYSFLHANATHLGFNIVWMLPFGAAVARRFGTVRFLTLMALASVGGALMHLVTHQGAAVPMIGASAAISGAMAAAIRFAFQRGGPISFWRSGDAEAYRVPALSLAGVLSDPRALAFLAVWFGTNLLFGLGSVPLLGEDEPVAWQAHIGGFLVGLLMFSMLDPVPAQPRYTHPGHDEEPSDPRSGSA